MNKSKSPRVFFNASVILAGLKNPTGGSGKLLMWAKKKKINGVISEIIVQEVIRYAGKLGKDKEKVKKEIVAIFYKTYSPPRKFWVEKYKKIMIDWGDAHVLASSVQEECKYLVSLDRKHILSLQGKIKEISIVSPKQVIHLL